MAAEKWFLGFFYSIVERLYVVENYKVAEFLLERYGIN